MTALSHDAVLHAVKSHDGNALGRRRRREKGERERRERGREREGNRCHKKLSLVKQENGQKPPVRDYQGDINN